ncbi:MAG: tetraacyldisaccharide 4'-kinase [Dysgonamonadaceae bacterium]|jgi:tetraacyldisaccharide 4'-kinase|nr:tetraacyldisaccharide 4'-kinase [Dysgonamonadaceae bacterium]
MSGKINKALLPFSWLYGLGVWVRNKLFDWKILPVETFDIPVISVGNLAVGGTGKTPHTEYLIRLLSKKYRVAVLSRGYKRKTRGFILAGKHADNRSIGDEPYQMHRKFPEIMVAVDSDRRRGIRNLLDFPKIQRPEVILLDDAFQHRYVKPSLSILLTDSRRPFYEDYLLPAGRLREPAKSAGRADIIIFTKYDNQLRITNYELRSMGSFTVHRSPFTIHHSRFTYKDLLPVFPEKSSTQKENMERLKKESYSFLLLAGLAQPEDLIQYLEKYTSGLRTMIYPDHHDFSRKDILEITENFNKIQNKNKLIITSEKDAVRLMHNPHIREEIKGLIYCVPIEVVFKSGQEELFIQKIENHVTDFTRNRIMAKATNT